MIGGSLKEKTLLANGPRKMFRKIYLHPWFPRVFYKKADGGPESGVTGYFLLEWKKVFSIGLLHFKKGSRENMHSHAFPALSWWLKGSVTEDRVASTSQGPPVTRHHKCKNFEPSLKPKYTPRENVHRVIAHEDTWAITLRGPWAKTWYEVTPEGDKITMTHGRKVVDG